MPTITPIYAGLIALLFIALSLYAIRGRFRHRVSVGDGGEPDMLRRIRVQANCAEYAPLGLLLLLMAELQGMPAALVHLFGAMLLAGRLLHAWGFSRTPQILWARSAGTVLTMIMIIAVALGCITHALT